MNVLQLAKEVESYIIAIRRDIHLHPEVSMEETRTIQLVIRELEDMNITYEVIPHGGVIGIIEGAQPGKSLVLRGDLDALPMEEAKENLRGQKKVVSMNDSAAHLCGHDGHTAMLLGAAKILSANRSSLQGRIILAFEQGEEDGKGIYRLLKRIVEMGADGVWGIHLKNDLPTGKISVDPGPRMAGILSFHVSITGKGGHGSRPDLANSPIDCFHDFYNSLQLMRMRSLNPFEAITYSIGSVHAGSSANVIPDVLTFQGTMRFLHEEQGEKGTQQFINELTAICDKHNCEFELLEELIPMKLFVHNDDACSTIAADAIRKTLGKDTLTTYPAWMASESFAFYQKYFPGVFAFVGIQNETVGSGADHHNIHFDIDEDALTLGVVATVQYALDFLYFESDIVYDKETRDVTTLFQDIGFPIYEPEND